MPAIFEYRLDLNSAMFEKRIWYIWRDVVLVLFNHVKCKLLPQYVWMFAKTVVMLPWKWSKKVETSGNITMAFVLWWIHLETIEQAHIWQENYSTYTGCPEKS